MIIAGVIPCYKTPDKAIKVVRQSYKHLDMVKKNALSYVRRTKMYKKEGGFE